MDPWTYFALMVASYFVAVALTPKPKTIVPTAEAFDDIDFPQVDDGTPQAVIFGDCWTESWTVLGLGNYRTTAIRKGGGGKK